MELANSGLNNIKKANKELVQANEYNKSYGKYWSIFFFALTIVILIFDYMN